MSDSERSVSDFLIRHYREQMSRGDFTGAERHVELATATAQLAGDPEGLLAAVKEQARPKRQGPVMAATPISPNQVRGDRDAVACKRCSLVLNRFTTPDGQITYVHSRPWEEHDHEAEPVPASTVRGLGLVCDFCSHIDVKYLYRGPELQVQLWATDKKRRTERYSSVWSGCEGCHRYIIRGDIDGLLERVHSSPTIQMFFGDDSTPVSDAVLEHRRGLWDQYIPNITEWSFLPPEPEPPFRLRPLVLPRVRDRLVRYLETDLAVNTAVAAPLQSGFKDVPLPGFCTGQEESSFGVRHPPGTAIPRDHAQAFLQHMVTGLAGCDLFYVSEAFTHIAVTSARQIKTINVDRREMPATAGFIAWETPVGVLGAGTAKEAPVVAASWTLVPGGVWFMVYVRPEDVQPARPRQELRDLVGFLYPANTGGGAIFGTEVNKTGAASQIIAVIQATWRLMRQPGLAEETTQHAEPRVRKQYARARRPEPEIRVINLRRHERKTGGGQTTRNYTHGWAVGWENNGFWRGYHVGPRDGGEVQQRWIAPYVARADLGFDEKDYTPKPAVRVLK